MSKFWLSTLLVCLGLCAVASAQTAAKGTVEQRSIESKSYGRARKISVYTPAGYEAKGHAPYGVLYFFDADDYLNDIALPPVLDELIAARKMPPVVAVLVHNDEDRLGDLANHAKFARFMVEEVVPFSRKKWNVSTDPQRTLVGGYSAGGLAAAYVGLKAPDVFGNVLSQSGAFWRGNEGASEPYEWLTSQYAASGKKPLRFYIEVGGAEMHRALGSGPVFIEATQRLRDVLKAKGYTMSYTEVPGAMHEPKHWHAQLPAGLMYLTSDWKDSVATK